MNPRRVLPLGLALSILASTMGEARAVTLYVQHDFGQLGSSRYQPLFAWCDGPDRVIAVSQPSRSLNPQEVAPVLYVRFLKNSPNRVSLSRYVLEGGGAAAGTAYFGLRAAGTRRSVLDSYLARSDILAAGQEYTSTQVFLHLPEEHFSLNAVVECRYFQPSRDDLSSGTVFSGASARRSVFIQKLPDGHFEYRSFDHAGSTPIPPSNTGRNMGEFNTSRSGIRITGGTRTANAAGGLVYRFENGGYVYRVEVGSPDNPSARVVVTRGGRTVLTEPFRFYSDSRPQEAS